ncbi:MAG: hypothetical protein U9N50_00975 [Pseudomonadota bacterium]|nr:hypothetical protein [Pseudomonadota bacterium]
MNNLTRIFFLTAIGVLFMSGDLDESTQFGFTAVSAVLVTNAEARVGRPLTPVSVGGVRRRTRRRTAVTTAAVVGTAAVVTTAAVASSPTVVVASPTTVTVGTSVTVLPTGCTTIPYAGITYHNCNGIYYKPAFQGNTVIYTVVENP